jgi:hypothetical protein
LFFHVFCHLIIAEGEGEGEDAGEYYEEAAEQGEPLKKIEKRKNISKNGFKITFKFA